MKKQIFLTIVAILATFSFLVMSCKSKEKNEKEETPIAKLFSSEQTLKEGITGKNFVSADNKCLMDFRRENRFKIFIKESQDQDWIQFDGEEYRITTNSKGETCMEFDSLDENSGDNNAKAVFTPEEFTLTYFNGNSSTFNDFKIVTEDEAGAIYEGGSR